MKHIFLVLVIPFSLQAQSFSGEELARWQEQASKVTVVRDNWGIPHIYGKTDADCVFGLLYVQCEDDFARVEMNFDDQAEMYTKGEFKDVLYYKEDVLKHAEKTCHPGE